MLIHKAFLQSFLGDFGAISQLSNFNFPDSLVR